jgi:hypothetical protein
LEANYKKILKAIMLELRHMLEGYYNGSGWHAGDLEQRLNALGVWRDRNPLPADELAGLSDTDRDARKVVDAYLKLRDEATVSREEAVAEFVRETAYTWANRLLALRCMESRELIDEVILQKEVYGGRSLEHNRLAQRNPELCAGDDDGLFAVLGGAFTKQAERLPLLFEPNAPGVALKPSVAALRRAIALLSGTEAVRGQETAANDVFRAPDAFGWAYQYWNTEEKERVFAAARDPKGSRIEAAAIVPATQLYTEPYMVKFLVQNSLGATWASIRPNTRLIDAWEYYVEVADLSPIAHKPVRDITFLDPACGSGHFLLEAFDLFYNMYEEEGVTTDPLAICRSIIEHNLYGIDIDERAIQISEAAVWMKAAEKLYQVSGQSDLTGIQTNLVSTSIRLPKGADHLRTFLEKHPEDKDLSPALEIVFNGLQSADELGSLLQIEAPVESTLKDLQQQLEARKRRGDFQTDLYKTIPIQGELPIGFENYVEWKEATLSRISLHLLAESEAVDRVQGFFGKSALQSIRVLELLSRKFDVVATNPPYLGTNKMTDRLRASFLSLPYTVGKDYYSAFISRCRSLCNENGYFALVTRDSYIAHTTYKEFREDLVTHTAFRCMAVLGSGAFADISGEVVSVALLVGCAGPDLLSNGWYLKARNSITEESLKAAIRGPSNETFTTVLTRNDINKILGIAPEKKLVFWIPQDLTSLLESFPEYEPTSGIVRAGLSSGDNDRVFRQHWEAPPERYFAQYPILAKGGTYTRYFADFDLVAKWDGAGRQFMSQNGNRLASSQHYFKAGASFPESISKSFQCYFLPKYSVFTNKGCVCFPLKENDLLAQLALFNSPVYVYLLDQLASGGSNEPGDVRMLRWPENSGALMAEHASAVSTILSLRQNVAGFALTSRHYVPPNKGATKWGSVHEYVESVRHSSVEKLISYLRLTVQLDYASMKAIGVSEERIVPLLRRIEYQFLLPIASDSDDLGRWLEATLGIRPNSHETDYSSLVVKPIFDGDLNFVESRVLDIALDVRVNPIDVLERLGDECGPDTHDVARAYVSGRLLALAGHRWPAQIESGDPGIECRDGVVTISPNDSKTVTELLAIIGRDFSADSREVQSQFERLLMRSLPEWITREFFAQHVSQFNKRPILWHLETKSGVRRAAAFVAFVNYHKLTQQTMSLIQSQYLRPQRQRFETEMRGIEAVPSTARSDRQQERLTELMDLIAELRVFDEVLAEISRSGFGPETIQPVLGQYAINDAMLCLKAQWLQKLSSTIKRGPLAPWCGKADTTKLHQNLAHWIADSMLRLRHHCSAVGPAAPKAETLHVDPNSESLAFLICKSPDEMVQLAIKLSCLEWWRPLDETVFAPLRAQIKLAKDELKVLKVEDYSKAGDPFKRKKEIEARTKELKESVKRWERDLNEKTAAANKLRDEIMAWECSEARGWETWLAAQPMYDAISSLDGVRQAPRAVAEWVAQESAYAPDLNDGVRVNIAPLQKAGILAAEVLASKDVDKAIADRAEWRADERRWCREGKIPQPGWWPMEKTNGSGQE